MAGRGETVHGLREHKELARANTSHGGMGEFPQCSGTRRETRLCDLAARGFRHGLLGLQRCTWGLYYTVRVIDLERRQVLKGALALAAGVGTGVVVHGVGWARHALEMRHEQLPLAGLDPVLDGVRVGFLTDLHLSSLVPADDVARAVAMVNAERPDLIVLGGDYVSFADRAFMGPVAEQLAQLEAPAGVFAIIGNHDDERYMPAELRQRRIEMLLDDRTALEIRGARLELAGLKFWTRRLDELQRLVRGASAPVLLLAHDPRRVTEAAALSVGGVLSGHTHGGQVVLPGLGAVAARKFPIAAGRLTRGATEMFVSRGVGTVYVPVRVNCPPEVAIVTLRRRQPATRP